MAPKIRKSSLNQSAYTDQTDSVEDKHFSSMLCACEAWVLTKESERKTLAFERKMLQKDCADRTVSEGNERGTVHKGPAKRTLIYSRK